MIKIRNIRDLENEKLKLRIKQLELEKQLERSWKRLSNNYFINRSAEPVQATTSFNFKTGNALLNGALNYSAIFLSHRVGKIAGSTIKNAVERLIVKFSQNINSFSSKKKRFQKD